MKKTSIIIALFSAVTGFSQTSIVKSSIDNGGASTQAGNLSMVYTIGEVVLQEHNTNNLSISEGFIHPKLAEGVGIKDYNTLNNVTIYPNPTTDYISINSNEELEIKVMDENGKLIHTQNNKHNQTVDFRSFARGIYFIILKNEENKEAKTFRVIKQ